jgi:hypothetical protein
VNVQRTTDVKPVLGDPVRRFTDRTFGRYLRSLDLTHLPIGPAWTRVLDVANAGYDTHADQDEAVKAANELEHLTEEDDEFAEQLAEKHPHITPGTALWNHFVAVDSKFEFTKKLAEEKIEHYFPDIEVPAWSKTQKINCDELYRSRWFSGRIRTPLLRSIAGNGEHVRKIPYIALSLVQVVTEREPYIFVECYEQGVEKFGRVKGSEYSLRLTEAAEIAHNLLALIDVAHGTETTVGSE